LVSERRYDPTQDLLSHLVAVCDTSDMFSEDELIATVMMLLIAGHETTSALISNGVLALLAHPEQYRALADCPDLADRAVEEVLRYDSPIQLTTRTVLEDSSIGDTVVLAGSSVLILIGAANHDPAAHANAAVFDITRNPTRHLAFGYGGHFCLGAPLARLQGKIILRELVKRAPDMRLGGEPRWRATATVRGLSHLPVIPA
jgi:cytochrome P450